MNVRLNSLSCCTVGLLAVQLTLVCFVSCVFAVFLMAGVLLLNAVLTVRAHQANSHKDHGWEQFTDAVIAWLNKHTTGTVFLLWGSYAQKKGSCIDKASLSCW